MEEMDYQDLKDHLVMMVSMEQQVKKEREENKENKDFLDQQVEVWSIHDGVVQFALTIQALHCYMMA